MMNVAKEDNEPSQVLALGPLLIFLVALNPTLSLHSLSNFRQVLSLQMSWPTGENYEEKGGKSSTFLKYFFSALLFQSS